jgi:hypothetical protein
MIVVKRALTFLLLCTLASGCSDSSVASDSGPTQDGSTPLMPDGPKPPVPDGQLPQPDASSGVDPCPVMSGEPDPALYSQHVLRAVSNGSPTSFTQSDVPVLEHASEGDAVIRPDGKIWIYFMNTNPGQRGIFVAEWQNDSFKTFDCARFNGKVRDDTADPDIVRLPDGSYRLFYSEFRLPNRKPDAKRGIFTATSTDGINFSEPTKVIEFGEAQAPTTVRLQDGTWLMAIAGTHGENIRLATSTDDAKSFQVTGKEWGKGVPELAVFSDGTIRMYGAGDGQSIERSDDSGQSWTTEKGQGVGFAGGSLIHHDDGSWTMYYKGFHPF